MIDQRILAWAVPGSVEATVKGDVEGHEFHGNQYTSSEGGGENKTQRQVGGRAPKGGVIGANDQFYKGGAFVASTAMPKMTPQDKKNKKYMDSKQEVAPNSYEKPPSPDHFSVYRAAGVGVYSKLDRSTGRLSRNESFRGMEGNGFDFTKPIKSGYSADELIEMYNSGGKWALPK